MNKNMKKTLSPYIALIFIIVALYFLTGMGASVNKISYSQFQKNLNKNKVTELKLSPNKEGSTYDITGKLKNYKKGESFYTVAPLSDDTLAYINKMQSKNNFKLSVTSDPSSSIFSKLLGYLPYLLVAG